MKSILAAILFLSVVQVQAGPSTSGGGGAFVCRDSSGQVTSSELLDLWEAKNLLGWNVLYSKDAVDAQITQALARLSLIDSHFADVVKAELLKIRFEATFLPPTIAIATPTDANHMYVKPGCPLEGMLYYDSERSPTPGVAVSTEIFQKLISPTDIAASWMHEAIYKVYRDNWPVYENAYEVLDSTNARRVTACVFSDKLPCLKDITNFTTLPATTKNVYQCKSADFEFTLFSRIEKVQVSYPPYEVLKTVWTAIFSKFGKRVYSTNPAYIRFVLNSVNEGTHVASSNDWFHLLGGLSFLNFEYGYISKLLIAENVTSTKPSLVVTFGAGSHDELEGLGLDPYGKDRFEIKCY